MEWIISWLNGISDTGLRAGMLAGLVIGFMALCVAGYQMVTGVKANRLLKKAACRQEESDRCLKGIEKLLLQEFGDRAEIRAIFDAPALEATVIVGKRPAKKPTFLLTVRRLLGNLFP